MRIGDLQKSIVWNLFGVPVVATAMCAVMFGGVGILLHSVFGTITRLNAEAGTFALTLFGAVAGIYTGWRNAYKLWQARHASRNGN
jgi:hypothetical protein